jgi:hypothetical protein
MRIPIYESKLVKTVRFEPEELGEIEQVTKIVLEKAKEARQDSPTESEVIRMLVRLGIEEFHRRERASSQLPKNMR